MIQLRTCNNLFPPLRHWRPLDSTTRTTTTARFDLKFFCVLSRKDTPECFIVLFLREKVALLSLSEAVKLFPGQNMVKLLTTDSLFPSLRPFSLTPV